MPGSLKLTVPFALPGWGKLDAVNRQYILDLVASMGSLVYIGEDPPANPNEGAMWWRTVDGDMYIYYVDATSSQWVAATATAGSPPIAPSPPPEPVSGISRASSLTIQPSAFAPIDFPPNPNIGDIFESPSGVKYQWDGVVWVKLAGISGLVPIDNNPPANPQSGQLWWRDEDGELFIYYFDGTTGQWVSAAGNTASGGGSSLPITGGTLTGDLVITNFQAPGSNISLQNINGNAKISLSAADNSPADIMFSRQGAINPDWILSSSANNFRIHRTITANTPFEITNSDDIIMNRAYTKIADPLDPNELTSKAYVDAAVTGGANYIGLINAVNGMWTGLNGNINPLPDANITNRMYVICTVPGTLNLPTNAPGATQIIMRIGDQLFSNGQAWVLIPVGADPPNMSILFSNRGPYSTNVDDITQPGSYFLMGGATGTPNNSGDFAFLNHFSAFNLPGCFVQEYYQYDTLTFELISIWRRTYGNNFWNPWQEGITEDAPRDGRDYVRRNGQWVPLP